MKSAQMCRTARSLSALLLSSVQTFKTAADAALKSHVSSLGPLSPSISLSEAPKLSLMSLKSKDFSTLPDDSRRSTFEEPPALDSETTSTRSSQPSEDLNSGQNVLPMPWYANMSKCDESSHHKDILRERRKQMFFKSTQRIRFNKSMRNCALELKTGATIEILNKLGCGTGEKEDSDLIRIFGDKVRTSNDEED